ncbi:helix-turn-helix domain-containing protein [Paenibacillus sp. GCM10012303]|uniref:helix-turn-helix domain-containing protein n=1 Tax=Paenibacillus sp. GCM10012303 TaxID=3317340 RepID=UPI003621BF7D
MESLTKRSGLQLARNDYDLSRLRLSAATSYLIHTGMSIQQISEETGFNSIHYFSRLFKQTYGVSPQQWRAERYNAAEELAD